MPSLESPFWLLALLSLPLVWWIHRFRNQGVELPVSTLMLWKNSIQPENREEKLTTADPLWRQRATIITILILALATPTLNSLSNRKINVWFDHSPSMHAIEGNQTRIDLAIQALLDTMKKEAITAATIHSLQTPSYTLQLTHLNKSSLQHWLNSAPRETSNLLPHPDLSEHETWLVTDGADPRLQDWVDQTRIDQIIQIGKATENTSITRLSIRPSLTQTNFTGITSVTNHGEKETTQKLQLYTEENILGEWPITLTPGETKQHTFIAPGNSTKPINARLLESKDALSDDDSLSLSIPEISIMLSGNCGKAIETLLQTIPGIKLIASVPATLTIACANVHPVTDSTTIWFHTSDKTRQIYNPPYWTSAAAHLRTLTFHPSQLRTYIANTAPLGETLLTVDDSPLISFQSTPKRLMEARLDINTAQLTEHPVFPIFITGIIEHVLEQKILERIYTIQNTPLQSKIRPKHLTSSSNSIKKNRTESIDLTHWFILVTILLLLLDMFRNRRTHG